MKNLIVTSLKKIQEYIGFGFSSKLYQMFKKKAIWVLHKLFSPPKIIQGKENSLNFLYEASITLMPNAKTTHNKSIPRKGNCRPISPLNVSAKTATKF